MTDRERNRWRFTPDPATAHAINQLAKREGRSIANMILMLVRESIGNRRSAEMSVDRLVNTLKGIATEPRA
jgi:hypothetical protein